MPNEVVQTNVLGNKRINELNPLGKLEGLEELIVDNGADTLKITVNDLMGYIAMKVNEGTLPPSITESTKIVIIPEGEDLPPVSRVPGNFYLKIAKSHDVLESLLPSLIKVSPNMGLHVIRD